MRVSHILICTLLFIGLNGCQSSKPSNPLVSIDAEALSSYNLKLIRAETSFINNSFSFSGSVYPTQKRYHVNCGQLQIQVFDTQGILLNILNTDYSPCDLHYQFNTRRAGRFSIAIPGIHQQPLILKVTYHKK